MHVLLPVTKYKSFQVMECWLNEALSNLQFWVPPLKLTELMASDAPGFLVA